MQQHVSMMVHVRILQYIVTCNATPVTGVFVDQIIHNRATFNWDNMNSSTCAV